MRNSPVSANTPLGAWTGLGVAIVATLPPAFTGHAASAGNHDLATSSIVVHTVAVTLWVGGLIALVWYARADGRYLLLASKRFSALALPLYLAVGSQWDLQCGAPHSAIGETSLHRVMAF